MSPHDDFSIHAWMNRAAVGEVAGSGESPFDDDIVDDVDVRGRPGGPGGEDDVVFVPEDVEPHHTADLQIRRERTEYVPGGKDFDDRWLRRSGMIARAKGDH